MDIYASKEKHQQRVRASKLRQAMQSLKSVGITPNEAIEYIKKNGFANSETRRQNELREHRKRRATEQKRVENLAKAREAKKQEKVVKGLEKIQEAATRTRAAESGSKSSSASSPKRTPKRRPSGAATKAKEATKALEANS